VLALNVGSLVVVKIKTVGLSDYNTWKSKGKECEVWMIDNWDQAVEGVVGKGKSLEKEYVVAMVLYFHYRWGSVR